MSTCSFNADHPPDRHFYWIFDDRLLRARPWKQPPNCCIARSLALERRFITKVHLNPIFHCPVTLSFGETRLLLSHLWWESAHFPRGYRFATEGTKSISHSANGANNVILPISFNLSRLAVLNELFMRHRKGHDLDDQTITFLLPHLLSPDAWDSFPELDRIRSYELWFSVFKTIQEFCIAKRFTRVTLLLIHDMTLVASRSLRSRPGHCRVELRNNVILISSTPPVHLHCPSTCLSNRFSGHFKRLEILHTLRIRSRQ